MVSSCLGLLAPTPPGGEGAEPISGRRAQTTQAPGGDEDVFVVLQMRRSPAVTPPGFLTDTDLQRLTDLSLAVDYE